MHIYAKNLTTLTIYILISLPIATGLLYIGIRRNMRVTRIIAGVLFLASLYGILSYTVLHRTPSSTHTYTFAAAIGNEFIRELYMNALLYFPFGLTLSVLVGPLSILIAFLLSVSIETWQFLTGTGLAQGTDVIMNTLGAAIGVLPCLIVKHVFKRQTAREQSGEQPKRGKEKS